MATEVTMKYDYETHPYRCLKRINDIVSKVLLIDRPMIIQLVGQKFINLRCV